MKAILVKTGYSEFTFITITKENKKEYYLDGKEVSKEYGNKTYLKLMKLSGVQVKKLTEDDAKEMIKRYMRSYDEYVEYIDNYRQYSSALSKNEYVTAVSKLLNQCFNLGIKDIYSYK